MDVVLNPGITVDASITILIIEDSVELNDVLAMGLKSFGFKGEILQAFDLKKAIGLIKTHHIDLFIVDWLLPDGEGANLVKKLRATTDYESSPILLITGREDVSSQSDFTQFGIGALLIKPFLLEDLRQELAKIYGLRLNQVKLMPKNLSFLIVDDQPDIVRLISEQLCRLGFNRINQAFSVKEAKEMLQKEKIDYIITDWTLEDGSCVELITEIKLDKKLKDLPIMVVTGRDSIEDLMTLVRLNVHDHLIKPFTFSEFEEKLTYCWERNKKGE